MKGDVSETMQVIFAILLVLLVIIVFIPSNIAGPSLSAYGDIQARLIARTIATSIDAISISDSGSFSKELKTMWDIRVDSDSQGYYVEVSHEDFSSGKVRINTPSIQETELVNTGSVSVEKPPGGELTIT
jgi:hypothetical protein